MPRSHNEARKVVCCLCFNKCKKNHNVTSKLESVIQCVVPQHDSTNEIFPSVVCNGCYIKLTNDTLTEVVDYDELNIKLKRHQTICSCKICETSKFFGHPKKNPFKFVIKKPGTGRPLLNTSKQKTTLKICGN